MLKTVSQIVAMGLVILISPGCDEQGHVRSDVPQSIPDTVRLAEWKEIIQEKTQRFTEAHITRDTAYLNQLFTEDARVLGPNVDIVVGRKAISQLNTDWVNYGIHAFTETSTRFYGSEAYLIDEGTYDLRYGSDQVTDKGKYINIWKNENGEWKIFSNIWNTSLPAVAPE